jgi:UDP-glucose:(heptosyl)LPS alpha-1,3-glucosyltransferase
MRHYRVAGDKIEVIYNGVDPEVFHPRNRALFRTLQREELGIRQEGFVVLFLGSGFRRKGLDGLLAAFGRVAPEIPEAVLVVAGKDRPGKYRRAVRGLRLEDRVLFLGPTRKAKELYAASDLFALPTLYDPFSNACLEAMATGVPVLTSCQNGVSELLADGKSGLVVPGATDFEAIADKLREFYHAPDRDAWGEEARKTSEKYSIAKAVARLLDIYAELKRPANA